MNETPVLLAVAEAEHASAGKGLPTTLMVQSVHDPATNISPVTSAHHRYVGSRLITVTNEGDHGIHGGVNKCADKWVNAFLTTGQTPAKDQTCRR
jgi:hypothetical protein